MALRTAAPAEVDGDKEAGLLLCGLHCGLQHDSNRRGTLKISINSTNMVLSNFEKWGSTNLDHSSGHGFIELAWGLENSSHVAAGSRVQ